MTIPYPGEIPDRVPTTMKVSAEWGNALRQRAVHIHATKASLTGAFVTPLVGTVGYVTGDSTNAGWWVFSGAFSGWTRPWSSAWRFPNGLSAARSFGGDQTGISALADVTGLSVTFTAINNRAYDLEAKIPHVQQLTAAGAVTFQLCTAANAVLEEWRRTVALNEIFSVHLGPFPEFGTIGSGGTTRKVRASTSAGTLSITASGAGQGSWIEAHDIGFLGGPA